MEPAPTTLGSLKENLMAGQACACVAKTGRKRRCNMLHYTIKDVLAQGGKTRPPGGGGRLRGEMRYWQQIGQI